MRRDVLLLIDDGTPSMRSLAEALRDESVPFECTLVGQNQLRSPEWVPQAEPAVVRAHLWVGLNASVDDQLREQAISLIGERLKIHFGNVVHFAFGDSALPPDVAEGRRSWFPVRGPLKPGAPPPELVLYIVQLFRYSLLQYRLVEYMADAANEMVTGKMLSEKNDEIRELNEKLNTLSRTDSLTGLYNRAATFELLERERNRKSQLPSDRRRPMNSEELGFFCVALFDVDHFKSVNDTYGHLVGDEVLRRVSLVLERELRASDIVGRIGGEEFLALLPRTSLEEARATATRICGQLASLEIPTDSGSTLRVTASAGVAEYSPTDGVIERVIYRADKALYRAKESGRNRVCAAE